MAGRLFTAPVGWLAGETMKSPSSWKELKEEEGEEEERIFLVLREAESLLIHSGFSSAAPG